MDNADPTRSIGLRLPPDAHLMRIARLTASGVATAAQFDLDEVDDVRIAVDEACTALIEGGDGGVLDLVFVLEPGALTFTGTTSAAGRAELEPERLALSRQILKVVVDDYDIVAGPQEMSVRLHKTRANAGADG